MRLLILWTGSAEPENENSVSSIENIGDTLFLTLQEVAFL